MDQNIADSNTFIKESTLDEPISTTILRDVNNIGRKIRVVLLPSQDSENELRNWDLWGPLVLCMVLSITLGTHSVLIFSSVFVIVWIGAAVVTINSQLLGGTISFFQSLCFLGYCIFPLNVVSILCLFIPLKFVRAPLVAIAFGWAAYASVTFMSGSISRERRFLATYPVVLFYIVLSWMVINQPSVI